MIAGARPEAFEDATLVGEGMERGQTFKAKVDLVESMGSELYVYFPIESERLESKDLDELAADSGAADVPGSDVNQVVARLDPASKVRRGEEAEIWLDTTTVLFFDPQSGERLGAEQL